MTEQLVIDAHAHVIPPSLLPDLATGRTRFPNVDVTPHEDSYIVSFAGTSPTRPVARGLLDSAGRSEWIQQRGIDKQVVGGWLDIFGYQLDDAEGADWARLVTEQIADLAAHDDRLVALGTVALQAPEAAARGLEDIHAMELPGVLIGTRAGERELDDPAYTPFWEAADELGSVIFIHPGFATGSTRYGDYGMANGLARIEDSTVAMTRLLYAGIPARYPGMKLMVAHGGGALPYVLGRLARNYAISGGAFADPVESFSKLFFDSVVFDRQTLDFLVAKAGADKVVLGSDFPFPIGDPDPCGIADQRMDILGGNATRLFGACCS